MADRDLVDKVLSDPTLFPDGFVSWIQRLIPGNPTITLDKDQLPNVERVRLVGGKNQPTFQHGSNLGAGARTCGFYMDPWGRVHIFGTVAAIYAPGDTFWQLPTGYRPEMKELFACVSDTGIARVDVDELGNIIFVSGGTTWVSLAGISFRAF